MPALSRLQIVFLAYNASVGVLVGILSARASWFEGLGLPAFAWLIAAMFVFEVIAGLLLREHPSTAITMGTRIAAIGISVCACFLILGILKST
jgi:hypothetical protein